MKHDIIKTDNYLLVVSDEEIKEGDNGVGFATGINGKGRGYFIFKQDGTSVGKLNSICVGSKKITAHLPLNNSRILEGVDLLPPLEDDVDKLSADYTEEWCSKRKVDVYIHDAFKAGYNKAKEKYKYTEEDLRKVLTDKSLYELSVDEIIQSLQQPKYPIGFECEMETPYTDAYAEDRMRRFYGKPKPKTTTNSQGQTVLEGKYIYEN
jgi:hypothetical protein